MPGFAQRRDKSLAAFFVRPVIRIAVEHEIAKAAREKMFRHDFGRVRVIFEHARELQMRPSETEIDRGFLCVADELGQVIARSQPRENALTVPAPRNDFLTGEVRGKMPVMFLSESFDSSMHAVVIPPERD